MAKLAIKGHETRGNEVIKILEMLGGKNIYNKSCSNNNSFYYISDEDRICELPISESYRNFILFTLEEFLEKHPYEVEDEVFIKGKNKKAIVYKVVWCCDTVTYWLEYDGIIEGNRRAEHLQPYKEEDMKEEQVKEILNRSAEEIKVEIIPVVINAIMDAFEKGFDAGMKAMLNNNKSNNHEA